MFLLILSVEQLGVVSNATFTFQYVSINTSTRTGEVAKGKDLHSNMFLLIQIPVSCYPSHYVFTFQYVSINTKTY